MAEPSTFFQTTLTFVTDTFGTGMFDRVTNFISIIAPIFEVCFGIFLLLWVLNFWANGSFTEMGIDFVKKCIAWSLIIVLVVNADQYMKIAKLIYDLDADMLTAFTGKPYDGNLLDITLDGFNDINDKIWAQYKSYGIKGKIAYAIQFFAETTMLHFFGGIFLIICFASYIVHKLLLVLTLLIGPLFIGLGLFPATRSYLTSWINQCATLTLTTLFIGLVGEFQLAYLDKIRPTPDSWDISDVSLFNLSLFLGTILFSIIIWNVPNLASAIVGGGAVGGGANFAKGMATGSVATAVKGGKGARKGWKAAVGRLRKKSVSDGEK